MALFSSMIRRSSSLVSLAVRTYGSPRSSHRDISGKFEHAKRLDHQRQFSNAAAAKSSSEGFPFKIINYPKFMNSELKREAGEEIIRVKVNSDSIDDYVDSPGIPIRVKILQTVTGNLREIDLAAFPDEFREIRINKPQNQSECAADSKEKKRSIIKDLEDRGITPNTIRVWKANFKDKESKQLLVLNEEDETQKRLLEEERKKRSIAEERNKDIGCRRKK